MVRSGVLLLVSAVLMVGNLPAQETLTGSFEAAFRSNDVFLNLRVQLGGRYGFSNYGRTLPRSDVTDLVRSEDRATFRIVRPAGVLAFRGVSDGDAVSGRFVFTPDASYRQQLERMKYSSITPENLFVLAVADVSIPDVKDLEAATTDDLTMIQLVRMVNHGVTPEFVKGMLGAGFRTLSSDELVRVRDHGVTPEYIRAVRKYGAGPMTLQDFVSARDHGVSEDYIAEMREVGLDLRIPDLVRARDHGVSADFVKDMADVGYSKLDIDDYVRLRDHGVTASFARRQNRERGDRLSTSELIRMRDRGY